ncbi:hypothetical protein [Microvirga arsenatis]|uniref:Uncharacterized protein n=1 Tax=Microvirga arsenatis TaxID=2692265 RepID=A0ABW9YXQ4_9HYPH|nr:hypothetical protein [Microvirga arsenatis]NBJ13221.1 hypothetical protein [Microvirga arsenatis]NBJ25141.1 hypothetical protein [Microvirga arsenatis]
MRRGPHIVRVNRRRAHAAARRMHRLGYPHPAICRALHLSPRRLPAILAARGLWDQRAWELIQAALAAPSSVNEPVRVLP